MNWDVFWFCFPLASICFVAEAYFAYKLLDFSKKDFVVLSVFAVIFSALFTLLFC
jgi:hypothetical protein